MYYYFLASRLLGSLESNGTQFSLADAQGSVVSAFNNASGGASMKSNQLFGPYGNARYAACRLNTAKGFIEQYKGRQAKHYIPAKAPILDRGEGCLKRLSRRCASVLVIARPRNGSPTSLPGAE